MIHGCPSFVVIIPHVYGCGVIGKKKDRYILRGIPLNPEGVLCDVG